MAKDITISVPYGRKKHRDFNIFIVPNRFNVDFAEYMGNLNRVMSSVERFKDATTVEELKEIEREAQEYGVEDILEAKYKLIRTIMIANEYEYERGFWDTLVSPEEVNDFINQCAMKDRTDEDKKKLANLALKWTGNGSGRL